MMIINKEIKIIDFEFIVNNIVYNTIKLFLFQIY